MSDMIRKDRDPYFDNLKGILIFLVCTGHCMALYKSANPICNIIYSFIYTFHMPLFFYISGYFNKNIAKSAQKAYEALLLPAIPFEILYLILHIFLKTENRLPVLTPVFAYWFLFVLFGYRLLMPQLIRLRLILPISIALAVAVGFNPYIDEYMSLSRFFCMLPFFLLGYYTDQDRMQRLRSFSLPAALLLGFAALGIVFYIVTFTGFDLDFNLKSAYQSEFGWAGRSLHLILAVPVSLLVIRLTGSGRSILTTAGQRTLQIYLLHYYGVSALELVNPLAKASLINAGFVLAVSILITMVLQTKIVSGLFDRYLSVTKRLLLLPEKQ